MKRLVFPEALRQELIAQAHEGGGNEVCGILAGNADVVERVFPIRNIANEIQAGEGVFRDRDTNLPADGQLDKDYYMDPKDYLRASLEMDELGLERVGYYHSHVRAEARPSPRDVRLATDLDAVYVLVGPMIADRPQVRAWRIVKSSPEAEEGHVVEVPLA
jgi:proteasome lid subunit RPN8/RPN11